MSIKSPETRNTFTFDLPKECHNAHVMVEMVGDGQRKSQAYYAHSLQVQMVGLFGQLKVTNRETSTPLPKVYVKVYVRQAGDQVAFFKDGYTDLRDRFDYSSVSARTCMAWSVSRCWS